MAERPKILFTHNTEEIDPQYMANFLGVELEEREDIESSERFSFPYEADIPLLIVRIHPPKRKIIVSVPVNIDSMEVNRFSTGYYNIAFLRFIRFISDKDEVFSDLAIMQRGHDGLINQSGIISDKYHISS